MAHSDMPTFSPQFYASLPTKQLTPADTSEIRLNADELVEWRFVDLEARDDLVIPAMGRAPWSGGK